jgi:Tfp pilus assembly protein PilV
LPVPSERIALGKSVGESTSQAESGLGKDSMSGKRNFLGWFRDAQRGETRPRKQAGCLLYAKQMRGLTLLEMMVAMSLLIVITGGLTMMFMQTQKAFRSGLHQVDVFESGRAAMELISRDAEQLSPSCDARIMNFIVRRVDSAAMGSVYTSNNVRFTARQADANSSLITNQVSKTVVDTNYFQDMFLLTHGASWSGVSYEVYDTNGTSWSTVVVGTLYRHVTNGPVDIAGTFLSADFQNTNNFYSDYQRVIDGVVRFKTRIYDAKGVEYGAFMNPSPLPRDVEFWNDQIPGFLEIEMGVLEPQTLELLRATVGNNTAKQKEFLEKNSGKIHLFRQQIPIRSVNR